MMGRARTKKLSALAFSFAAAFALQGCVAAVIPLAAGGLMTQSGRTGSGAQTVDAERAISIPVEDVSAAQGVDPARSGELVAIPSPTQGNDLAGTPFARDEVLATASAQSSTPPVRAPEPAPAQQLAVATPSPPTLASPSASRAAIEPQIVSGSARINQFLSYANQRQIGRGVLPDSAMLSDRLSLEPERAECKAITPTVLIDLDPEEGIFDPATSARPPSGLAIGLARLRLNGVAIAWISGNSSDKADAVRLALARTGLDIHEEDRLLLLRNGDDRKQKLREELAEIGCLIAIAGDTRSDFDELYDYLLNPADAQSLEPLIGEGWFLIPQPLLSERPNP